MTAAPMVSLIEAASSRVDVDNLMVDLRFQVIRTISTMLLAFLPSIAALAEMVSRCGASSGMAYYFEGPFVPREDSGWQEDKISNGEILLSIENESVDIIYKDAAGMRSSAGGGFSLFSIGGQDHFIVMAVSPSGGVVEHYLFELDGYGNGKVAWGTVRAGGLIQKSALMTAKCATP